VAKSVVPKDTYDGIQHDGTFNMVDCCIIMMKMRHKVTEEVVVVDVVVPVVPEVPVEDMVREDLLTINNNMMITSVTRVRRTKTKTTKWVTLMTILTMLPTTHSLPSKCPRTFSFRSIIC
jgi:hypothetical protein